MCANLHHSPQTWLYFLAYLGERSDEQAMSSTAASHKDMASVAHHMQAAAHTVGCTALMPQRSDISRHCACKYMACMACETHLSSWVMMTSWKFSCSLLVIMMLRSASARLALFSASRLVVGSSSASIPQFKQKVSASASLMIRHASTCSQGLVNASQGDVSLD